MVCFALSENREMEREPHCRFCKKSLISGKRVNTVPIFGVSRNKTLLVDSGQDCVVLAQSFESLRFPLEEGESFSDLSCLTSVNLCAISRSSCEVSFQFNKPLQ